jgi:hypothetical protein
VKEEVAPITMAADSEVWGKEVDSMTQFKQLGKRFKTCMPTALTDEGLEYVVTCIKHIYDQHIVLQFTCMNTFKEQVWHLPFNSLSSRGFNLFQVLLHFCLSLLTLKLIVCASFAGQPIPCSLH